MPGLRFWPRGLQEFLAGLWGASSCSSCSSASSSCQIREACDVETCVSTWENTTGNTPRHPPGQAAACKPSPVPSQPASPCSTVRSRPPPRLFSVSGAWGAAGLRRAALQEGAWAAARQGLRGAEGSGVGSRIPVEPMRWHWWVQVARGAGSSQSRPSFCDPNRIFQMTANPKPPGAAGSRGADTAQPVTALLWWVGMLQQPIAAQLPGGLFVGSQSQPGPSLCR